MKQARTANQTPKSVEASSSVAGGIPATFSTSLQFQASPLAVSGVGFSPISASIAGAANQMQGRPNFVVRSFLNFFTASTFCCSFASECHGRASPHHAFLCTKCTCFTAVVHGCTRLFAYPTKTSDQIVSGKFVELSEIALLEHHSNTLRL